VVGAAPVNLRFHAAAWQLLPRFCDFPFAIKFAINASLTGKLFTSVHLPSFWRKPLESQGNPDFTE
jgi:hypothetical protein